MENFRFELNVEGISCIKCVGRIEKALKEQNPSPSTIKVDFITNKVVLTMPQRELIDKYVATIQQLGFEVVKMNELNLKDEGFKRQLKLKLIKGNSEQFQSLLSKSTEFEVQIISSDQILLKYDPLVIRGSEIVTNLRQEDNIISEMVQFELENPFEDKEDIKFSNYSGYQFTICLLCMLFLVLLSLMPDEFSSYPGTWGMTSLPMLATLLMTAIIMKVVGISIFKTCIKQFAVRNYNMITLISLGSGLAFILGLVYFCVGMATAAGSQSDIIFYICNACQHLQTSAAIFTSVVAGKYIQGSIKKRVHNRIYELKDAMKAKITTVTRFIPKNRKLALLSTQELHPALIERDDLIYVKEGMLPFDGFLEQGTLKLMENAQFGSETVDVRSQGHRVVSGSTVISIENNPIMRITEPIEQTVTGRLFTVIKDSAAGNSLDDKTSSFIGDFTKYFIIFIFATSGIVFVFWSLAYIFGFTGMQFNICYPLEKAIAVLVASCPCALGISLPMIYVVAMRKALKNGVLVKDSSAIDTINEIDTIVFDKTGTITGTYNINTTHKFTDQIEEAGVWEIISLIERDHLQHPIGLALYQESLRILALNEKSKASIQKNKFENDTHKYYGSEGIIDTGITISGERKSIALGNEKLMKRIGASLDDIKGDLKNDLSSVINSNDISVQKLTEDENGQSNLNGETKAKRPLTFTSKLKAWVKTFFTGYQKLDENMRKQSANSSRGHKISLYLALEQKIIYKISLDLEESLKANVHNLVFSLKRRGKAIHLLTGDSRENASKTAESLGINPNNVKAEVTPYEKEDYIKTLVRNNNKVMMVGDGINDIKAFQEATLSCTINFKSPQNLSFSNFVIIDNDVENIRGLFKLGRATKYFKIAILATSILYNIPAILASSGVLMLLFEIDLPAFMAAWTMFISSIILTLLANLVDLVKFKSRSSKKVEDY